MLFQPNKKIRPSKVFSGLYALLHEVLLAQCGSRSVDLDAMPVGLWKAVEKNNPTIQSLADLCAAVDALKDEEKLELWLSIKSVPSACELICDTTTIIPTPPKHLHTPLKNSVIHLFDKTAKLVKVEEISGESVADYCHRYASDWLSGGNGNVCSVCGTEELNHIRYGIATKKQWRASIDHLLAEASYPLIALDPKNLLPVCYTCNSKAKHGKDLLHDKESGDRRICFDPWIEGAERYVGVSVINNFLTPEVVISWNSVDPVINQKLETWDTVYQIKSRIKGKFSSLPENLLRDLKIYNISDFRDSITASANRYAAVKRSEPYNYWRKLIYCALESLPDKDLEEIRVTCEVKFIEGSQECFEAFGI